MAFSYGNFKYSVDKIKFVGKLNTRRMGFNKVSIHTWCYYGLPDWVELLKETPEDYRPFHYRWSCVLRCKGDIEGVFYISEHYNGDFKEQREQPTRFLIEYNPNKNASLIYDAFCDVFVFRIIEILSCDLAYDVLEADARDIYIDTKCDVMTYGKVTNRTLYIAPKEDRSGRVKIYQKDLERETKGKELEKTLRIEVTLKGSFLSDKTIYSSHPSTLEQLTKAVEHLNAVKIKKTASDTDDWKLYALSHLSPEDLAKCLGMMTAPTRRQYKQCVCDSTYYTLELDIPTFVFHITTALGEWTRRVK